MQTSPTQLTLRLNLHDEATFDNFYAGKNAEIIAELKLTASGQGERVIYLTGSRDQGCSHLLQACCHHAHQHQLRSVYLPLAQLLPHSPEMLYGLELDVVCIDDMQLAAQSKAWEEALFHFYNRVYDAGGRLIFAANDLPKAIHLTLPDLVSRLSWGIIFQLHSLSDVEKLTVLKTRAARRGISFSEEVGKYILTHCSRHMGALLSALDALDEASLAAQRRLTIPFVKAVLKEELADTCHK